MSATGSEPNHEILAMIWPSDVPSAGAGFSLLEMLLVILLMGLMATITAVSVQRGLAGARNQAAAGELVTALRRTRLQAVVGGLPADFKLDLIRDGYSIGDAPMVNLPRELQLAIRYARETSPAATGQGRIRFFPDGSSSGGRITLRRGSRQWQLDVSWLTGGVAVSTTTVEQ